MAEYTPGTTLEADPYMSANRNGRKTMPDLEKTKEISYSATADQIYAISSSVSSTTKEKIPNRVELENVGPVPLVIMSGYETYSNDTTDGVTEYLHTMLMPGEIYTPPVRAIIRTGESSAIMDGTIVSNATPSSNMYADISTVSSGFDNTTDPVTITSADGDFWRVGDMVRCNAEVVEITAISGANLTVKRGMKGTTPASHGDGETLRLQFSNDYEVYNKYSVCQLNSKGKFKASNFFGLGRTSAGVQGLVPGSIALKFFQNGYQDLVGGGGVSANISSGLATSTAYQFMVNCDNAGATNISFTTDSSDVTFGNIVKKIQAQFNSLYYVTASNLFEKKVYIHITNEGNLRVTSGQRLSTSSIRLTDSSGSDTDIFGAGRIPSAPASVTAVDARLPDDVLYNNVTYNAYPNEGVFCYDNGLGKLVGAAHGEICYERGKIDITSGPPNSEFVISCLHTSAFSGKLNEATADRINSLVDIYANTTSQKWNGSIKLRTY
tara:strand:- start:31502 stop:32986 length:1485 start_codon:yes stop_codon:yes gene_type:complete